MDKKLEARVARLERMLDRKSVKNETVEISSYEKMAIKACKKAFDALNDAARQASSISLDDNWSGIDWGRVAHDLNTALSYFPADELNAAPYDAILD